MTECNGTSRGNSTGTCPAGTASEDSCFFDSFAMFSPMGLEGCLLHLGKLQMLLVISARVFVGVIVGLGRNFFDDQKLQGDFEQLAPAELGHASEPRRTADNADQDFADHDNPDD